MSLVDGHLLQHRIFLLIKGLDADVIALQDCFELLDHRLGVRLSVPLVVAEHVHIVRVAAPVDLHCLQKANKLLETRHPVDTEHI